MDHAGLRQPGCAGIPRIIGPASRLRRRLDRWLGWHRYYHAVLGRFDSRDRRDNRGGPTKFYECVNGNPLMYTDPTGESVFCWCYVRHEAGVALEAYWRGGFRDRSHDNQSGHNAMLHCRIACRIQQRHPRCSKDWDARERNPKNPEDKMDLDNNANGRGVSGDCWKGCLDLWRKGQLDCLDEQNRPIACPPPPEGFPEQEPTVGETPAPYFAQ